MKVKTLIVGLGNPGPKYDRTRHNVGFMVLDALCHGEFKLEKKFEAEICEQGEAVLMKPQTFMNLSGKAVQSFADYYDVTPENIWIVHDDIDIPFGEIRIREGGSSAGHKGIDSIIDSLGEKTWRFRVGVKNESLANIETESFVLHRFNKEEEEKLAGIIDICAKEIEATLEKGIEPNKLTNGQ